MLQDERSGGPIIFLQGKMLDSTPVMALNNNMGLPLTVQSAVPAGLQGAPRPTTLVALPPPLPFPPDFSAFPLHCQRRCVASATPAALWAHKLFLFKRFFFPLQKERLSVHQALSSSAEMLFARA